MRMKQLKANTNKNKNSLKTKEREGKTRASITKNNKHLSDQMTISISTRVMKKTII